MAEQLAELNKDVANLCTKPTYWNTGETWTDGKKSYYVRQGNIVTIFAKKSAPSGYFLNLPVGYRPIGSQVLPGTNGSGNYAFILVDETGDVQAASNFGVPYIWATGSFYTADPFPYSDL